MNKILKKTLKIFGILIAVILSIPLLLISFFLIMNWKDNLNHECQKGPLADITECTFDKSAISWMSSGFWMSDAKGKLDESSCRIVTNGEKILPFDDIKKAKPAPITIYKVSCDLFGVEGACYASQRMASNGNSRYVKILIVNGCDNVRYFEGSKYTIQNGKPQSYDLTKPLPDIPEEMTGKGAPIPEIP